MNKSKNLLDFNMLQLLCILVQDRQMELMYINYYTEQYGTLGLSLKMADILRPTDVIVNFGVWLNDKPANTTCGDTLRPWHHMGKCPYMHEVCEYFMAPEHKHPFNLWWATTTPGLERSGRKRVVVPKVPLGHNLNAESACGYDPKLHCFLVSAESEACIVHFVLFFLDWTYLNSLL